MSETASEAAMLPECNCVGCRRARRLETYEREVADLRGKLAACEGVAGSFSVSLNAAVTERDEALALAFQRGRELAATIHARDEARSEAELLRRSQGRVVIQEGPASGQVFTELGVRQLLDGREELAAKLRVAREAANTLSVTTVMLEGQLRSAEARIAELEGVDAALADDVRYLRRLIDAAKPEKLREALT